MPEKCHIFILPVLVHFYAVADTARLADTPGGFAGRSRNSFLPHYTGVTARHSPSSRPSSGIRACPRLRPSGTKPATGQGRLNYTPHEPKSRKMYHFVP